MAQKQKTERSTAQKLCRGIAAVGAFLAFGFTLGLVADTMFSRGYAERRHEFETEGTLTPCVVQELGEYDRGDWNTPRSSGPDYYMLFHPEGQSEPEYRKGFVRDPREVYSEGQVIDVWILPDDSTMIDAENDYAESDTAILATLVGLFSVIAIGGWVAQGFVPNLRPEPAQQAETPATTLEDIDDPLVAYILKRFKAAHGIPLVEDDAAMTRVRAAAQQAQDDLENTGEADINLPYITPGKHLNITITLDDIQLDRY